MATNRKACPANMNAVPPAPPRAYKRAFKAISVSLETPWAESFDRFARDQDLNRSQFFRRLLKKWAQDNGRADELPGKAGQ